MRALKALCLAVVLGLAMAAGRTTASEGFDDIAKLAKSGIAEEVLVAYVQSSQIAYDLTVDEILYLNDLGVSSKTITAVVDHGKDLRAGKTPVVWPVPVDDLNTKPLDADSIATSDADLWNTEQPFTPDPVVQPVGGNVAENDPAYQTSPYANSAYENPEVYREKEIVRDTVYVPTVVNAPPPGQANISLFYESLTPYGTWVNIGDSWCWQPSVCVTDVSWRPYGNRGHWVATDSGWCWESDYSWGWAPFHYGRWHHATGYGWLWTPDTVWGPAWVSWRESDSHYGWAPLPPSVRYDAGVGFHFGGKNWGVDIGFGLGYRDYAFVPRNHFCDYGLNNYFVPGGQQVNIYNQTTIIQNNITYVNNRPYVNGPRRDRVERDTNRKLKEVRLADNDIAPGQPLTNTTRFNREKGELSIYRPNLQNTATVTPAVIAARQLAAQQARDNRMEKKTDRELAASAKADELRERHLATVDARKDSLVTRREALLEDNAEKRADFQQKKLEQDLQKEQNAQKRAEIQAAMKAEADRAEAARKQKLELNKQAAEQKRLAEQLARERDRAAREAQDAQTAKIAAENKARLAAERQAREEAQKAAALDAQKAAAERKAQLAAQKANNPNTPNNEAATRLEAQRAAREAAMKRQAEVTAQRQAQLEAERAARLQKNNTPAANTGNDAAAIQAENNRKAQMEAARAAKAQQDAAEKAQADAARQAKAQQLAQEKAAREAAQNQAEANRKAQMEAARAAKAQQDAAEKAQAEATRQARQQQLAQEKAAREAAADQAEANRKAQLEAARAARQTPTPATPAAPDAGAEASRAAQAEAARQARQQAAAEKAAQAAAERAAEKAAREAARDAKKAGN